ncbi:ABC transporter permease [Candidatus Saccharibacteria bacterium]|nr:ABC transporter permease [Candidatus Saccharibacteria bacterium]MCL1963419.1 ABC transporter permease [Candidatus Saccharibacteria bacterium]
MKSLQLRSLIARNLRVYFSDPVGVFLSLIGAMIVVFLYIIFLSNMQVDGIMARFPMLERGEVENLMNTWLMAGAGVVAAATTGLGAMITFVNDRSSKRFNDFLVSPIRRGTLTLGYICANIIVSSAMTVTVFLFGVVYSVIGGAELTWTDFGWSLAALLLCVVSFSALFGFIGSLLKTANSFSATSVVITVMLGFLAGVYLPIGQFPETVNNVVSVLPFSQGASLVRSYMMRSSLDKLATTSKPAADYLKEFLGVKISVGDFSIEYWMIAVILGAIAITFAVLMTLIITRKVR